ncbi:hypothetical protein GCM10010275_48510 [Streptomyces litmocidini]|uniref:hypothetical protein n=1 Tax=Streptomyces litmocidini TaxID=67318 RepID=UPI00167C5579|nr:hypothetical protein [Streptomyces litmocidini]GGV03452.1 hypothetical protein GCM10010275_48510 [Streptomyces litmocidini]
MVRTRVKLAATLTVVVLALTGFHTGKGGHGSSGGGSGKSSSGKSKGGKSRSHSHSDDDDDDSGGGCSSDEQGNDDYEDYDGSGGSTATASPAPTATDAEVVVDVIDCVEPAGKKRKGKRAGKADTTATVRVMPRTGVTGTFRIVLEFERADGSRADSGEIVVGVESGAGRIYDVPMKNPGSVGQVKSCHVHDVRREAGASPSPSSG